MISPAHNRIEREHAATVANRRIEKLLDDLIVVELSVQVVERLLCPSL